MNNISCKKGFTLVELVVTIAILLMLATIAVVSVSNVLDKSDKDINTIQKKLVDQAIKSYTLENCDTGEICEIENGDLDEYFEDSTNMPDIDYPITVIVHENGKIVSSYSKNLGALIINSGLADDEFTKSVMGGTLPDDKGIYEMQDSDGTTYFFRGAVQNNYVEFANFIWRIVRINGDGSIRLMMNKSIKNSSGNKEKIAFNENNDDEKYVGYTYDNSRNCIGGELNELCDGTEGNPSTIKTYLDNWYNDNLSDYDKYIASSRFCNDTTLFEDLEYGTMYGSLQRMINNNPTYVCPNTNKDYGGEYKLKIGLLSMDEFMYACNYGDGSLEFEIFEDHSISISPSVFNEVFLTNSGSKKYNDKFNISTVINLKSDVQCSSGDGTSTNPYKIVTE